MTPQQLSAMTPDLAPLIERVLEIPECRPDGKIWNPPIGRESTWVSPSVFGPCGRLIVAHATMSDAAMAERVAWLAETWLLTHCFVGLRISDCDDRTGYDVWAIQYDDAGIPVEHILSSGSFNRCESIIRATLAVAEADRAKRGQEDAALDVRYGQ